jgi:hypothetical protein
MRSITMTAEQTETYNAGGPDAVALCDQLWAAARIEHNRTGDTVEVYTAETETESSFVVHVAQGVV